VSVPAREVTYAEIIDGLRGLELGEVPVAVHASLSSFGHVDGGASTVIDALTGVYPTVLVPTYSSLGTTLPPEGDRPGRNGIDYARFAELLPVGEHPPFDPESFGPQSQIDEGMGIVPLALLAKEGAHRSGHPFMSWAAYGRDAVRFVADHAASDPMGVMRKLNDTEGWTLLLGVGLDRCSAIHFGEELAGRQTFIRWVRLADGTVQRVRTAGCSTGFPRLQLRVDRLARRTKIGDCEVTAYAVNELVAIVAQALDGDPTALSCEDQNCPRCCDAAAGGPIDG